MSKRDDCKMAGHSFPWTGGTPRKPVPGVAVCGHCGAIRTVSPEGKKSFTYPEDDES